jgi:hypothetical protein
MICQWVEKTISCHNLSIIHFHESTFVDGGKLVLANYLILSPSQVPANILARTRSDPTRGEFKSKSCFFSSLNSLDRSPLSSCPPGFVLSGDGRTCRDVDECSLDSSLCEHDCVNTEGSFRCTCPMGFTQIGRRGGERCIDTDECVEQPVR